jgi:hypothetical protein
MVVVAAFAAVATPSVPPKSKALAIEEVKV